jgi:hypothetical protein
MNARTQATEEREPTQIRLLPSLRVKLDKHRADTGQSRSEVIEEALVLWFRRANWRVEK